MIMNGSSGIYSEVSLLRENSISLVVILRTKMFIYSAFVSPIQANRRDISLLQVGAYL